MHDGKILQLSQNVGDSYALVKVPRQDAQFMGSSGVRTLIDGDTCIRRPSPLKFSLMVMETL